MDEMGGLGVACGRGRTLGERSDIQVCTVCSLLTDAIPEGSVLGLHASQPESTSHELGGGSSSVSWTVLAVG